MSLKKFHGASAECRQLKCRYKSFARAEKYDLPYAVPGEKIKLKECKDRLKL